MEITFLVGNGFEIAAGMKTSYRDFYKWYLIQRSNNDLIKRFKRDIGMDINEKNGENWSDLEIGLGNHTLNYSRKTITDYLECCNDIQNSIVRYIETEQTRFGHLILSPKAKSFLVDGLATFYEELLNPSERIELSKLCKAQGIAHNAINFISFNYTDSLDSILMQFPNYHQNKLVFRKEVIHVHGLLNENPILGVNDASQIANWRLRKNQDLCSGLIKSRLAERTGQKGHSDAKRRIKESTIICVFGMSLGKTDAFWWETIMKWLSEEEARHLIIYWYNANIIGSRAAHGNLTEIDDVKNRLREYTLREDSNVESVMKRVHVIINTKKVLLIPKE